MHINNATNLFPELSQMLTEARDYILVRQATTESESTTFNLFKEFMKKRKYWPAIQIKTIKGTNLMLLSNTYNKKVDESFQALYDQCRSTVIDPLAPEGQGVIVSMGASIPERVNLAQFEAGNHNTTDYRFYSAMEGSAVYAYHHEDAWHFGTTTMPSLDATNFHDLFDEALKKHGFTEGRASLEQKLDVTKCYTFVLVHHKAKKFMDYTPLMGLNYATVYIISARDRTTLTEDAELPEISGIGYPECYKDLDHVRSDLNDNDPACPTFGVIAKTPEGRVFLILSDAMRQREEECLGHANEWYNMLYVFKKQNPEFPLEAYVQKYLEPKQWESERDPVELIEQVFSHLTMLFYRSYRFTTHFFTRTGTYKVLRDRDAEMLPCIRFHLAQLRLLHIGCNPNRHMDQRMVFDYLCHQVNLKDLRILMDALKKAEAHELMMTPEEPSELVQADFQDLAALMANA